MKKKSFVIDNNVQGPAQDSFEQVNKYGTYNIQPTGDMENEFPCIAQGLGKGNPRKYKPNGEKENK